MFRVHVIVRETGGLKPEYAMDFDLPELPRVGNYLSVRRPDAPLGKTEDLVVRQLWWHVSHPECCADAPEGMRRGVGEFNEISIECAKAIGPYSAAHWREDLLRAERDGKDVEIFDVEPAPFPVAAETRQPNETGRRHSNENRLRNGTSSRRRDQ